MRAYGFSRFVSPFGEDQVTLRVYGQRVRDGHVRVFVLSLSKRFIDERSHTKYFQQVINCRLLCGYRFAGICADEAKHAHAIAALRSLSAISIQASNT